MEEVAQGRALKTVLLRGKHGIKIRATMSLSQSVIQYSECISLSNCEKGNGEDAGDGWRWGETA